MTDDPRLYHYAARVVSVHDGDTVTLDISLGFYTWLHARPCRLLDVMAPELGTVKAPIEAGMEATYSLVKILGEHRFTGVRTAGAFGNFGNFNAFPGLEPTVIVQTRLERGGEDKYGRVLGTLWLPGQAESVNAQMARLLGGGV